MGRAELPRARNNQPTRQLYAQIREDVYLAAKARAAEMRVPLREFIESALESALSGDQPRPPVIPFSVGR